MNKSRRAEDKEQKGQDMRRIACWSLVGMLLLSAVGSSCEVYAGAELSGESQTEAVGNMAVPEGMSSEEADPNPEGESTELPTSLENPGGVPTDSTAKTPAETPMETISEEAPLSVTLTVDDTHRYESMERSYQDGYLPQVRDGIAVVVLPLAADGAFQEERLTVVPELGSTENSPFVYQNYQRTVRKSEEQPLDGGEKQSVFLIRLELALSSERKNGVYPVVLNVSGKDRTGAMVQQAFTVFVTISDGVGPVEETTAEVFAEAPEETVPQSQPLLYIESYQVQPETVQAGDEFLLTAVLRNTSKNYSLQKIAITVSSSEDSLTLLEESNTIYWETLSTGATRELQIRYRADADTPVGKYHISLSLSYDNDKAVSLSSSGDMVVTVTQAPRVEGEYPTIASEVNAGDTITLSFQAINMGRSPVYNVRFELDAPGLMPSGSAYVGNLEAGTAGAAEMKVFVGSKSMNRELAGEEDPYGVTTGTLTMYYEDELGNEYQEEQAFSTSIHELVIGTAAQPEDESEGMPAVNWWIAMGVGAVLIGGMVVWGIYWRRKRQEG